jgi:hypothetical protein
VGECLCAYLIRAATGNQKRGDHRGPPQCEDKGIGAEVNDHGEANHSIKLPPTAAVPLWQGDKRRGAVVGRPRGSGRRADT